VLLSSTGFKYNTLAELKQAAAETKKPFSFGTWGVGSVAHMIGELIRMEAGIPLDFIPFQGATPATTATLGGHVDLTVASAFTSATHFKGGKAKALAIGGTSRSPDLPQVPTFAELGYPRINSTQWHGIAVRAGGQRDIVDRLYKEVQAIFNEPQSQERILKSGYTKIDGRSPAAFAEFIAAETETWGRVVKASGVTAER
jgi:tripartite-type tricarboxylate transporter receptor subunit TctC